MLGHFDHRFATYRDATQAQLNKGTLPRLTVSQHDDPHLESHARYWVARRKVADALDGRWDRDWLLGWRDITTPSNERTFVPSVLPTSAVGDKFLLAFPGDPAHGPLLHAVWSSIAFDRLPQPNSRQPRPRPLPDQGWRPGWRSVRCWAAHAFAGVDTARAFRSRSVRSVHWPQTARQSTSGVAPFAGTALTGVALAAEISRYGRGTGRGAAVNGEGRHAVSPACCARHAGSSVRRVAVVGGLSEAAVSGQRTFGDG
jgi:hypothetical protein